MWTYETSDELYHHGTKGQKWGIRRYQNPDGSLTEEGRKRYSTYSERANKLQGRIDKNSKKIYTLTKEYSHSKQRQKLEIKRQKLQRQHDRLEPKRKKIQDNMLIYGKQPSKRGQRQLKKAAKVDAKLGKVNRQIIKGDTKVSKLELQNTKYQHQIDKMVAKVSGQRLRKLTPAQIEAGRAALLKGLGDTSISELKKRG